MVIRRVPRSGAHEAGFGLIEVVVVIGLIGIVTAVAVPSYIGVQNGVRNAATLSDLGSNRTAITEYSIDNNGGFPSSGFNPRAAATDLIGYGWSQSAETTAFTYVLNSAGTAWCLDMTNATNAVFHITTNSKGSGAGACTTVSPSAY